jgi:hypothetical protein
MAAKSRTLAGSSTSHPRYRAYWISMPETRLWFTTLVN